MPSTTSLSVLAPNSAIFQQRRVDVLLSVQKAAHQIGSILELDELLDTIVHRIAVEFGCIESSILLVEGDQFHLAAVHGCTQSSKGERWPVTEGLSGQVVITGRAHYAPDVSQELHYRACEPHSRSPWRRSERRLSCWWLRQAVGRRRMQNHAVALKVTPFVRIECKFWLTDDGWNGSCEQPSITVQAGSFEQAKSEMEIALGKYVESVLRDSQRTNTGEAA